MSDITIYDAETDQVTSRKYTRAEKNIISSAFVHGQEEIDAANQAELDKFNEKQNAIQALAALGLTESQAKAVIGI